MVFLRVDGELHGVRSSAPGYARPVMATPAGSRAAAYVAANAGPYADKHRELYAEARKNQADKKTETPHPEG